jgi:hypothetical protein
MVHTGLVGAIVMESQSWWVRWRLAWFRGRSPRRATELFDIANILGATPTNLAEMIEKAID